MINLYPKSIDAVSDNDMNVISVQHGYIGLVQVSRHHSGIHLDAYPPTPR